MSEATTIPTPATTTPLPTHLDLPDTDGLPMMNGQQPPQSDLLTQSLRPRLQELHPDGQFLIGDDLGVYWNNVTAAPLSGSKCPDWFCVLGVPPLLDGGFRRSYVMWHEPTRPTLLVEYVSGDGQEERDTTPNTGKFWVYENRIRAEYYAIFDCFQETLEVYHLENARYVLLPANPQGRVRIDPLGVELGLWHGSFQDVTTWWVRVWDASSGEMLPSTDELAERHRQQAEAERQRTKAARQQAKAARQQADAERQRAEAESERAEAERQRAEAERQRAEAERQRAEAAEQNLAAERQQTQEQMRLLLERLRAAGLEPPDPAS